jgi:hypothetical protein
MNRLCNEDRVRVLACLIEGNSIRATVRITGIANGRLWFNFGTASLRTVPPGRFRFCFRLSASN